MAWNPFTGPTLSGYNASPPPDDGSATEANRITWAKSKTKLADPLKTYADAIKSAVTTAFGSRLLNAVNAQTSTYTVQTSDAGKIIRCTGTFTVTLPELATVDTGWPVVVLNAGTGAITIDGDASETINGSATQVLAAGEFAILSSDSSDWTMLKTAGAGGTAAKTSAYTVAIQDNRGTILADASSAAFTVTLPAAATAGAGFRITIKKSDSSTNTVTIDGDGTEEIDGATTFVLRNQYEFATLVCDGSDWQVIASDGRPYAIKRGTSVSPSGTAEAAFTGLPSGLNRITVMMSSLSSAGTSLLILQLGDSGGYEGSGYQNAGTRLTNGNLVETSDGSSGAGFDLRVTNASYTLDGSIVLTRLSGNTWVAHGALANTNNTGVHVVSGAKGLSAELDRLRITPVNGSDTFDAGEVNIIYE